MSTAAQDKKAGVHDILALNYYLRGKAFHLVLALKFVCCFHLQRHLTYLVSHFIVQ
jgi:hypothetical protein